ncbi:hypothetical protein ACI2I2_24245 [Scandinavium sp. NPDC088450]|uniref:hypothetical protein n=1 Tax=Scandinavium sp. NPDC088450 TaxID=3364514 RepID=UPI0038501E09
MLSIRLAAENIIIHVLKKKNVPEQEWPVWVKKTGRGMLLASIPMIVPLLVFDHVPLALTIVLQLAYAALMCLGLMLATDDKKTDK